MTKITLTNELGTFTTSPMRLDWAIARYLPASVNDLRALVARKFNTGTKYDDLGTVAELLMVLASWDQPGGGS